MQLIKAVPTSPFPGLNSRVISLLDRINPNKLRKLVEKLSYPRYVGSEGNIKAIDDIINVFCEHGFPSPVVCNNSKNIVWGSLNKAEILIGAHFDSVAGTPGADDNASAVAVLLNVMYAIGTRPNLACVFFNGEENNLIGSKEFMSEYKLPNLKIVHILEMVGFTNKNPNSQINPLPDMLREVPSVGDFLCLIGNYQSKSFFHHTMEFAGNTACLKDFPVYGTCVPYGNVMPSILLRSDHASFWAKGIPAIQWTDTAEYRVGSKYHTEEDTPDSLDYEFMSNVAKLLALSALHTN